MNRGMITRMKPEHFDILGTIVFLFITCFALYALFTGRDLPAWSLLVLLLVGIGGLSVDSSIVFKYFIRKK